MNDLPPVPELVWLEKGQNPFNLRCLDVRSFTTTMISTAADKSQAHQFSELRKSRGEKIVGKNPENSAHIECQLRYPHHGATRDGSLFMAREMEDKWDIFLYEKYLYFCRSWSGLLVYKTRIDFLETQAVISSIDSLQVGVQGGIWVAIAAVDFLVKSHLYRREAPHSVPPTVPEDEMGIAAYSFKEYGRWASYASFEDTSRVNISLCPLRG